VAYSTQTKNPEIYAYNTGLGLCPRCQSPNVRQYRVPLSPLRRSFAWLARLVQTDPMAPRVVRRLGFECQACSTRWG